MLPALIHVLVIAVVIGLPIALVLLLVSYYRRSRGSR